MLTATASNADKPSFIEEKIQNYVLAQEESALQLLTTLVNINSGTENIAGVRKVGDILIEQFKKLGFKTYWVNEPQKMHRAGTLIAKRSGNRGKRLLLIGHLDTVFPQSSTFKNLKHAGDLVVGPGVIDDKGGIIVILYALKALANSDALNNTNITVVLTGDEEDSGKPTSISRKPLVDIAVNKDVALDFEPAGFLNEASIGRRGISLWDLTASGSEAHSSLIFKEAFGFGAAFELVRILNTARTIFAKEKYLSFNPSLILAGTDVTSSKNENSGHASGKRNVMAKTAIAHGDLRYLSTAQKNKAKTRLHEIVSMHLPKTNASISFIDGIPAMLPTKENATLLKAYAKVSTDLGYGEVHELDPASRGAGDISFIAGIVPSNLIGLGPVGYNEHAPLETLELKSLGINTVRAAVLIYRLTSPSSRI